MEQPAKARLDPQEPRGQQVLLAPLGHRATMEREAPKAFRALRVHRDRKGRKGHRATRGLLGIQALQA